MPLPPISTVRSLPEAERVKILDLLFEPSQELHALCLDQTLLPLGSFSDLISRVEEKLKGLSASRSPDDMLKLENILGSHPRLGEKHVDSEQSRAEQASLKQGGEDERVKLAALNKQYEERFPGLRYVVFVNGRPRQMIMEDMQERIAHNGIDHERQLAIQAMCDIANDRASGL